MEAAGDLARPRGQVQHQLADGVRPRQRTRGGLFGRHAVQHAPERIAVPGVAVPGAAKLVENGVALRAHAVP
jgi:hypothetical protein